MFALKLSPIFLSELSSSSIRFHPPNFRYSSFNIPSSYYPCPFFSILFSQIFKSFVDFCSGWKRMAPTPKIGRPLCLFCVRFVFIGQGDQVLRILFTSIIRQWCTLSVNKPLNHQRLGNWFYIFFFLTLILRPNTSIPNPMILLILFLVVSGMVFGIWRLRQIQMQLQYPSCWEFWQWKSVDCHRFLWQRTLGTLIGLHVQASISLGICLGCR